MRVLLLLISCFFLFFIKNVSAGENKLPDMPFPSELKSLSRLLSLPAVNDWSEAKKVYAVWGRKPGQERWELKEPDYPPEKIKLINRSLKSLGFVDAIFPKHHVYEYAVILGGSVPVMIERLDFLIEQWNAGVRFKHLIFLTGQRPLSPVVDAFKKHITLLGKPASEQSWNPKTLPVDESESAQLIYAFIDMPDAMRKVPVKFSLTPRRWIVPQKQWQRANTAMTVDSWLKENQPPPGAVLAISNQPFVRYQHEVIRERLPKTFSLETTGPATSRFYPLSVKLDAVWLWLKNIPLPH